MKHNLIATSFAALALVASSLFGAEPLSLASLFTDHAVLQRDMIVPVWGHGPPGVKVVVQFAGQEKSATVDENGRWMVKLDPLASFPRGQTLVVLTEPETVTLMRKDVAIGEVWLCSGQSNMGFALKNAATGEAAVAAAGDDYLRWFAAKARPADEPQTAIEGEWLVDSAHSAADFSAVAYFFGKHLREKLGVPIGLIESAVGGTVAEAWTPRAELENNPVLKPLLEQQAKRVADWAKEKEAFKAEESERLAKYAEEVKQSKAAGRKPPKKPQLRQDPGASNNRPAGLYNGAIAPLQPYAIRGVVWYQGESNSGRGKEYQTLFPALIDGWRKAWGQGDFAFLFAQIAPHKKMTPELREAQRITTQITPNTAMAVTVDVGDAADIHPKKKQPVGERLALAARALAYGEAIEFSGPAYDAMSVDRNRARLTFTHIDGGLVAKDGPLRGFTIAGANGKFVDAKAEIDGDAIVVSSPTVPAPVTVRYGWENVPDVNLFNGVGLPASPFHTDGAFQLEPGFELLFNGVDLTGWRYKNGPAFNGQIKSSDGRYTARDGRIVVNPGKGTAQLWTTQDFPRDFHLLLEFRAGVNADSGVFLRGPQLQCRDYLAAGPYKELKSYKPQDWNEIEVIVNGEVASCACNGESLSFPSRLPASGPIGLEADRGQMEYRRIRIKAIE